MDIGIDVLEIERIKRIADDDIKLGTLFNPKEIEYFKKFDCYYDHVAGFFCAKEAIVKALRCGFNEILTPLSIEISHSRNGDPVVKFLDGANDYVKSLGYEQVKISISHSKTIATAVCLVF